MRGLESKAVCHFELSKTFMEDHYILTGKSRYKVRLVHDRKKAEKIETKHSVTLETASWNPLHFAVYYGQVEVLRFLA
jgi:hypothetical protein